METTLLLCRSCLEAMAREPDALSPTALECGAQGERGCGPSQGPAWLSGVGWCCHLAAEVSAAWLGRGWWQQAKGRVLWLASLPRGLTRVCRGARSLSPRVLGCCRGWGLPEVSCCHREAGGVLGARRASLSASLGTTLSSGRSPSLPSPCSTEAPLGLSSGTVV